ncbi:hypothetical protein GWK91_00355 [Virgibacillus sp. MSP4-1]|uniref:hypothetical protein n=1 Tax=Virgibacillus sp. MSP4-1 TaxID=2700081 RepID=UPI0003A3EB03|nr:hypothetical protein [Virgibacillus sp. MSP4-1]QHS21501.1 hypothetical protein GWK91_00355 [Virgibacillus sp. MSP4-1]
MSIAILVIIISWFFYRRHVPVRGVGKLQLDSCNQEDVAIVDTRDYQISSRDRIDEACCVPVAYLKRHYQEIPKQSVIIVASDRIEKNLSARILRKKGMRVIGYSLVNNE